MLRDDIIDVMHRYRRGEIKSADDAADAVIDLLRPKEDYDSASILAAGERSIVHRFGKPYSEAK